MTTRGEMKATIRRELRVGNRLDADLDGAIEGAIDAYSGERFSWAESRTQAVLNTDVGQEFYGPTTAPVAVPALGRLISIDYVTSSIGTTPYVLTRMRPKAAEIRSGIMLGQPSEFSWYEELLRIYPVPGAVYPVRVAGLFRVAPPANDDEQGNAWMTIAKTLILCRSKAWLAEHRMRDMNLHADMMAAAADALSVLRQKTTAKTATGRIEPFW